MTLQACHRHAVLAARPWLCLHLLEARIDGGELPVELEVVQERPQVEAVIIWAVVLRVVPRDNGPSLSIAVSKYRARFFENNLIFPYH